MVTPDKIKFRAPLAACVEIQAMPVPCRHVGSRQAGSWQIRSCFLSAFLELHVLSGFFRSPKNWHTFWFAHSSTAQKCLCNCVTDWAHLITFVHQCLPASCFQHRSCLFLGHPWVTPWPCRNLRCSPCASSGASGASARTTPQCSWGRRPWRPLGSWRARRWRDKASKALRASRALGSNSNHRLWMDLHTPRAMPSMDSEAKPVSWVAASELSEGKWGGCRWVRCKTRWPDVSPQPVPKSVRVWSFSPSKTWPPGLKARSLDAFHCTFFTFFLWSSHPQRISSWFWSIFSTQFIVEVLSSL